MAGIDRKPLQGVANIIRFNWHYYALALMCIGAGLLARPFLTGTALLLATALLLMAGAGMIVSLAVSCYVYDFSGLYALAWLPGPLSPAPGVRLVNIHAGFDETSALLRERYPQAALRVLDFYDPRKHTEISIRRARKAHPPFPGTQSVTPEAVPLAPSSADCIFLILAAHEIRDSAERTRFFARLRDALSPDGKIVVVEHLRDWRNFLAYNFGFYHFYPGNTWRRTFCQSELSLAEEAKITPFVSVFILQKNDTAP
jgi:SAM-dependent methyltransferase